MRALALDPWLRLAALRQGWPEDAVQSLPPVFPDSARRIQAIEATEAIFRGMLPQLAEMLNRIHNRAYSLKAWTLLLGPWLQVFIDMLYFRYRQLQLAKAHPWGADALLRCPAMSLVPIRQFWELCDSWSRNTGTSCSIYGAVADFLGMPVEYSAASEHAAMPTDQTGNGSALPPPHFTGPKGRILFGQAFRTQALEQFGLSIGAAMYVNGPVHVPPTTLDRTLLQAAAHDDEFLALALSLLPSWLPASMFEEFSANELAAEPLSDFSVYHSGTWPSEHTVLRMAAAKAMSHGAVVTVFQHGGAYGQYSHCPTERLERSITHLFGTWGWKFPDPSLPAELYPLPQPGHAAPRQIGAAIDETVLWASSGIYRFTVRLQLYPQDADLFTRYVAMRRQFLEALPFDVRRKLRFRPYPHDVGFQKVEQAMLAEYPEVAIDREGGFEDAVRTCKLFVCDHMGTSFLRTFMANIPTVIFWDKELTSLHPNAAPFFAMLEEVGILHGESASAAAHVHAVWDDVQAWWSSQPVQDARTNFMQQFCKMDEDWESAWRQFFDHALALASPPPTSKQ